MSLSLYIFLIVLFLDSHWVRLDYQPMFRKWAGAPSPELLFSVIKRRLASRERRKPRTTFEPALRGLALWYACLTLFRLGQKPLPPPRFPADQKNPGVECQYQWWIQGMDPAAALVLSNLPPLPRPFWVCLELSFLSSTSLLHTYIHA